MLSKVQRLMTKRAFVYLPGSDRLQQEQGSEVDGEQDFAARNDLLQCTHVRAILLMKAGSVLQRRQ